VAADGCRPCSHAVCPIGHGCATAIGVDEVLQAVTAQRLRTDVGSGRARRAASPQRRDAARADASAEPA
jgi:hypothetical protein